jgi:hypothetical protein
MEKEIEIANEYLQRITISEATPLLFLPSIHSTNYSTEGEREEEALT